jgi:hypothetical protein
MDDAVRRRVHARVALPLSAAVPLSLPRLTRFPKNHPRSLKTFPEKSEAYLSQRGRRHFGDGLAQG